MKKKTSVMIILFILLTQINCDNSTILDTKEQTLKRSQHKMAKFWKLHFILSPVGLFFNGIVLYLFVGERKTLIKSINIMLWYGF